MQKIADGDQFKVPATIEDATALTEISEVLRRVGYGRKQDTNSMFSGL